MAAISNFAAPPNVEQRRPSAPGRTYRVSPPSQTKQGAATPQTAAACEPTLINPQDADQLLVEAVENEMPETIEEHVADDKRVETAKGVKDKQHTVSPHELTEVVDLDENSEENLGDTAEYLDEAQQSSEENQEDTAKDSDEASRASTNTVYTENEEDTSAAIFALEKAIQSLKASKPSASVSLLQVQSVAKTVHTAMMLADALGLIHAEDKKVASLFLQSADGDAPEVEMEDYKVHSADIISTLEKLLKDFKATKVSLDAEEVSSVQAFQMLMQDKTDSMKAANHELEESKAMRAQKIADIAQNSEASEIYDPDAASSSGGSAPALAESKKLFVGSLPDGIQDAALRAEYSKYGVVQDVFVKPGCEPGCQWAFVSFTTTEQAAHAQEQTDGVLIFAGAMHSVQVVIAADAMKAEGSTPEEKYRRIIEEEELASVQEQCLRMDQPVEFMGMKLELLERMCVDMQDRQRRRDAGAFDSIMEAIGVVPVSATTPKERVTLMLNDFCKRQAQQEVQQAALQNSAPVASSDDSVSTGALFGADLVQVVSLPWEIMKVWTQIDLWAICTDLFTPPEECTRAEERQPLITTPTTTA